ncbi:hypothetical protein T4B_7820 [Trichinella pseudospiralis]|uniref:Uncharacterized protein n=1 Tax=Trichinella pseudospiralis TaxID=6337 RepID=A0A0V1J5X9_TRIPS|nr:hypothetical protein T4A_5160 [Trichinella pseudospiralis]KRZ30372.1 hypothetical protein T4B_7820 [Trichinella pseudospiralis]
MARNIMPEEENNFKEQQPTFMRAIDDVKFNPKLLSINGTEQHASTTLHYIKLHHTAPILHTKRAKFTGTHCKKYTSMDNKKMQNASSQ